MFKSRFAAAAAVVALAIPAAASAATVYDIPHNGVDGNCVFNTTCGPQFTGNTFGGQQFTVGGSTTLTSGSFTAYNNNPGQPTGANWIILAADGAGGLPGTVVSSGTSTISSRTNVGSGFGLSIDRHAFSLPGVTVGAGTYYFAFQAVSTEFAVYLAYANGGGAVQSNDGGASWAFGYEGTSAVASSLESAVGVVPEPGAWALLILGFGAVGGAMRRRKAVTTSIRFA